MSLTPRTIHRPISSCWSRLWSSGKIRTEARITQRRGERGNPYLMPLEAVNKCNGEPFISRAKLTEVMQPIIQFTPSRGKPICRRMSLIKVQLTLSKALVRSSLRTRELLFLDLIEWRASCVMAMGSVIWRFLRNPYCWGEIKRSRKGLRRSAATLTKKLIYKKKTSLRKVYTTMRKWGVIYLSHLLIDTCRSPT